MKYLISASNGPFGETVGSVYKMDPQDAILQWMRYSEKYPTCVSIQPHTPEDGRSLLQWASDNFAQLDVWAKEYHCPYDKEWLHNEIQAQLSGKISMQWEYDQLHPFCEG